ncbi:MAG: YkgJ family cysteine cluster protein [Chlamydiota bacterium]
MSDLPWYKDGLRFSCTQCGKCCTGSPGFVWVSEEEMHAMAAFLRITLADFMKHYTRRVGGKYSLLEHSKNYDCVFLKNSRCSVYGARPKQCRTFPWWDDNLKSPESWKETAERCEGVNAPDAPLISLEEIQKALD